MDANTQQRVREGRIGGQWIRWGHEGKGESTGIEKTVEQI